MREVQEVYLRQVNLNDKDLRPYQQIASLKKRIENSRGQLVPRIAYEFAVTTTLLQNPNLTRVPRVGGRTVLRYYGQGKSATDLVWALVETGEIRRLGDLDVCDRDNTFSVRSGKISEDLASKIDVKSVPPIWISIDVDLKADAMELHHDALVLFSKIGWILPRCEVLHTAFLPAGAHSHGDYWRERGLPFQGATKEKFLLGKIGLRFGEGGPFVSDVGRTESYGNVFYRISHFRTSAWKQWRAHLEDQENAPIDNWLEQAGLRFSDSKVI